MGLETSNCDDLVCWVVGWIWNCLWESLLTYLISVIPGSNLLQYSAIAVRDFFASGPLGG